MPKEVDVTYVTGLGTWGFLNGVINVSLTTTRWLPEYDEENEKTVVVPSVDICADLRLDLYAAQQLHEALGVLIEANTKPKVEH